VSYESFVSKTSLFTNTISTKSAGFSVHSDARSYIVWGGQAGERAWCSCGIWWWGW